MSKTTLKLDTNQLKHLAALLMGMAYADGDYDGKEAQAIGEALRQLVPGQELPSEVSGHLARFDAASFSIEESCQALVPLTQDERAILLSLIGKVADADGVHDLEESDYMRAVGAALGASPKEYASWVIEVMIPQPPPLPGD